MAVTASVRPTTLLQAERMWQVENSQNLAQFKRPTPALEKMLRRQTMRIMLPEGAGPTCSTFKIWFPDWSAIYGQTAYDGSTPQAVTNCEIPAGPTLGSLGIEYAKDAFPAVSATIASEICNNQLNFDAEIGMTMQALMAQQRDILNKRFITFLNANVSANIATGRFPEFTIAGPLTNIPAAQWSDVMLLAKLNQTALFNRLPEDYEILDGWNFGLIPSIAPYLGLNDSSRSTGALWDLYSSRYTSDAWNVDTIAGAPVTFLYNPYMVGLHCTTEYPDGITDLKLANPTQVFTIEDPVLRHRRIEVRKVNGQNRVVDLGLVPIRYNVEVQDVCGTQGLNGALQTQKNVRMWFSGGFNLAPTAAADSTTANRTGILKMVRTA